MALLHHMPHSDFSSLFRLLDDYDAHRSGTSSSLTGSRAGTVATFSPRFDVREAKEAYYLDGELPGIDQKDINIEFTDAHTLVINGRTERTYEAGTPPGKRITSGRAATVEDEEEEERKSKGKGKQKDTAGGGEGGGEYGSRYWVSERSVGEFQRSFNFPTRVDQDGVKASLKHGVLSVKVPKVTAPQTKKIRVE